jgi:hypothetical protein
MLVNAGAQLISSHPREYSVNAGAQIIFSHPRENTENAGAPLISSVQKLAVRTPEAESRRKNRLIESNAKCCYPKN